MEKHDEELDLREVERFQRHPLVFAKFDALEVGESFVLVNDHDPVPLHGQMEAMRPHQLTWEYIEGGPGSFAFEFAVWHRCADPKRHPAPHHRRCGESGNRGKHERIVCPASRAVLKSLLV